MEEVELQKETKEDLILRELDKINRRFDGFDNKLTEMYIVNERIKKEASFKRTYTPVPIYGAKHISHSSYYDNKVEFDDDNSASESMLSNEPVKQKSYSCCTII